MEGVSTFPAKIEYTGPTVTQVAACSRHTLILNSNGNVLSTGFNVDGRLGIGSNTDQKKLTLISYVGLPISKVACWDHSLFLDNNGAVFASGSNGFGKMAIGNSGSSNLPKRTVFTTEKVTEIAAGISHSLFLTTSGVVYSVGGNTEGQLGSPATTFTTTPVPVQFNETITKIFAGEKHSMLLTFSGKVIVFGDNTNGQLGDGTTNKRTAPFELPLIETIQDISGGKYHSLLLTNKSEIYSFGRNLFGELCDGSTTQRLSPIKIQSNETFMKISTGQDISVLLTTKNEVYTCGRNDKGQLGDLSLTDSKIPIKTYEIGKKFKQISSSTEHSVVLSNDGIGYSFGSNQYFTLGITNLDPKIPNLSEYNGKSKITKISSGNGFSVVLSANKTAFTMGNNGFGNLGTGDFQTKVYPTQINYNESNVDEISAGYQHLMILSKGTIQAVGHNLYGELGVGSSFLKTTTFNDINYLGPQIVKISAGSYFSMLLTSNGEVHTFGKNDVGQLGDGTNVNRYSPVMIQYNGTVNGTMNGTLITQISCGNSHSLILSADGRAFSFGLNNYGQLGIGNLNNKNLPNLIFNSTKEIFIQISAGGFHSLMLSKLGVVFSVGRNHKGQLGIGNTISISIPTIIRNDTFNETISKISAGDSHSLILDKSSDVYAFGQNSNGQLGIGNKIDQTIARIIQFPKNRIIDISAGFDHSLILEDNIWTNTPQLSPHVSPERSSMFTPLLSPIGSPKNSPKKSPQNSPQYSPKLSYGKPSASPSPAPVPIATPKKSTNGNTPQNSPVSNSNRNYLSITIC